MPSSRAARVKDDPARARHLRKAGIVADCAADTCRPDAWDAAYDAAGRVATYLHGLDPGLPRGPAWEAETAWQTQRLRHYLASDAHA